MDTKNETPLEWTAPRLMRLNQADGTDKHLLNISEGGPSPSSPGPFPTCGGGYDFGGSGAGNVCGGPS